MKLCQCGKKIRSDARMCPACRLRMDLDVKDAWITVDAYRRTVMMEAARESQASKARRRVALQKMMVK